MLGLRGQPSPSPNLRVQMPLAEQNQWLGELDSELAFALNALKIPTDVQARMSQMGFQLLETWAKVEDSQAEVRAFINGDLGLQRDGNERYRSIVG